MIKKIGVVIVILFLFLLFCCLYISLSLPHPTKDNTDITIFDCTNKYEIPLSDYVVTAYCTSLHHHFINIDIEADTAEINNLDNMRENKAKDYFYDLVRKFDNINPNHLDIRINITYNSNKEKIEYVISFENVYYEDYDFYSYSLQSIDRNSIKYKPLKYK